MMEVYRKPNRICNEETVQEEIGKGEGEKNDW